ncbi:FHA domain-containing protein [Nannocystaceae bacterium ST9]
MVVCPSSLGRSKCPAEVEAGSDESPWPRRTIDVIMVALQRSSQLPSRAELVGDEDSTTSQPWSPPGSSGATQLVLEVVRGTQCGDVFSVCRPEHVVGRGNEADLRIRDAGISRAHARLVRLPQGIVNLIDLRSRNGTAVNGVRVDVTILRPGDRIQLGPQVELRFGPRQFAPDPDHQARSAAWLREHLTARQLQIARLVGRGLGNREIAEQLDLRVRSVESHLDRIYAKLEIRSRSLLTRMVVEAGLLERDPTC